MNAAENKMAITGIKHSSKLKESDLKTVNADNARMRSLGYTSFVDTPLSYYQNKPGYYFKIRAHLYGPYETEQAADEHRGEIKFEMKHG